jgi:hypothetical protein
MRNNDDFFKELRAGVVRGDPIGGLLAILDEIEKSQTHVTNALRAR